jgi:uncharacterized protein (TIGR02145 family)
MKRNLFLFIGFSLLLSCEYQNNGVTSINDVITSDYLLVGNLDTYIQNNQIVRLKGKPGVITVPIGNADLSKYEPCFVLNVATGTTKATTVSSAIIKLDGMEVLNTSDFSKNNGQYTFEVCNLTPTSVLTVEVRGEPGSYVDVWIEGKLKGLKVTDCSGNIYKTVNIGNQIWMAENLRTTRFNDCTQINLVEENWGSSDDPAYCWYNNDPTSFMEVYGALYNWSAVNTGKLCPIGWHVPTDEEWTTLSSYLGDESLVGGKLKEIGFAHWIDPNVGATNETGFTALPGGFRYPGVKSGYSEEFGYVGQNGLWWSSTEILPTRSWGRDLVYNSSGLYRYSEIQNDGFSVRCLKDN